MTYRISIILYRYKYRIDQTDRYGALMFSHKNESECKKENESTTTASPSGAELTVPNLIVFKKIKENLSLAYKR